MLRNTEKIRQETSYLSPVVRKPAFSICENKDADWLRGYREADQHLCFLPIDSAIPLLSKSELSSLWSSSVAVQPCFCRTWSENPKTGFLTTRPILADSLRNRRFTICLFLPKAKNMFFFLTADCTNEDTLQPTHLEFFHSLPSHSPPLHQH